MDESSKTSQPVSGERSSSHPRPFFYVQPAAQPFYTYQWHMNHPFGQHGFPGSAFHFGRPYMLPYSYLQYPGYIMPQAAVHPVDYRRIHERNFQHAPGCEASLRQYQHGQTTQRETTCVGAQTDPSEALNKLIECLDQLRASDGSQTSGSLSPLTKDQICEEESGILGKKVMSNFNKAEADRDTSCSRVEHITQEEESSLGSEKEEEQKNGVVYQDCSESTSEKNLNEKVQDRKEMEWEGCISSRPSSQSSPAGLFSTRKVEDKSSIQDAQDISCCILHLPIEKVLSSSVYAASISSPSLGSPLNYAFRPPQLAHERVSVLSPSLDELSSHDELISTDLDDIDLFPSQIYPRGKLADITSRRCHSSDLCLLYPKKLTCAACGSRTFKELSRTKTCRYEDVEDSDEVEVQRRLRTTSGRGQMTRRPHLQVKHKLRAAHYREKAESQHDSSRSELLGCETCMCSTEKSPRTTNARPAARRCRATSDQLVRDSVGANTRSKACRTQPLPQRPQRLAHRKARFKPPVCQGSRNDEEDNDEREDEEEEQEVVQYHRTKGATVRGGTRC